MPAEILLPHGSEFVPVADIPRLIAEALNPDASEQEITLSYLMRNPKPEASEETRNRSRGRIDEEDQRKLLDGPWKQLPPLPEKATAAVLHPYIEAANAEAAGLDWELFPCWENPSLNAGILRVDAEMEHRARLKTAIIDGRLKAVSSHSRIPVPFLHDSAEVSAKDLADYVAQFHIQVRIASADEADEETHAIEKAMGEERARMNEEAAQRRAEGFYFLDEAADEIALQRGKDESWALTFRKRMIRAAEGGQLVVRDPATQTPNPQGQRVTIARLVTRHDVNAWLDGSGYRWEAPLHIDIPLRPTEVPKPLRDAPADTAVRFTHAPACGHLSSGAARKEGLITAIKQTMELQERGYFVLNVAAQLVADSSKGKPHTLLEEMRKAFEGGRLTARNPESLGSRNNGDMWQPLSDLVSIEDLDAWLTADGRDYRFPVIQEAHSEPERLDTFPSTPQVLQSPDSESGMNRRGLEKREVMAVNWPFRKISAHSFSKLLSDVPNWIKPARMTPGRKGVSATWNPVLIAVALIEKGECSTKTIDRFMRSALPDWLEEWEEIKLNLLAKGTLPD